MNPQLKYWKTLFEETHKQHLLAVFSGALYAVDERHRAVEMFHNQIAEFRVGADSAIPILKSELEGNDHLRRNTAIRILTEVYDHSELAQLSKRVATFPHYRGLSYSVLKQLWSKTPPPESYVWGFIKANDSRPMIFALLTQPTDRSKAFLNQILNDANSTIFWKLDAIRAIAYWNETDFLWNMLVNHETNIELRINLAFYIALQGDRRGIDLLMEIAHNEANELSTVQACYRLSLLAYPHVINRLINLIKSDSPQVFTQALGAVFNLSCVDLVPRYLRW